MANVHGISSVRFTDGVTPASVAVNWRADDTVTLAQAITASRALATLENGISDDAITGIEITITDPTTHAVVSGAETKEGVNIAMETSAVNRDWTLWVPSLKDSLIVSGEINIASGAIFDFAAELVTPSGALVWETPYENAYDSLESAAKSTHKLRNLDSKKSKASNPV